MNKFSDFGYLEPFQRYSRSNSKVVRNRAQFWTFFRPPKFQGAGLPKVIPIYHPYLTARRMEKFCGDTPISPEVLFAHTLNFKPDFKFSRLKFFGGTPVPLGVCASKPSSISSACKNMRAQHPLRAEILYAKKVHFSGSKLTVRSP